MADTTEATVPISATANAALLAARSYGRIRVHAAVLLVGGTVTTNALVSSVTTSKALNLPLAAGLIVLPFNPAGWFDTVPGEGLSITLAGTSPTISGAITYSEV